MTVELDKWFQSIPEAELGAYSVQKQEFVKKEITKTCSMCKQTKSLTEFYKRSDSYKYITLKARYKPYCKDCWLNIRREWRKNNPERYKQHYTEYNSKNMSRISAGVKRRYYELKVKVIAILGGKCVYCGCDDLRFLEINHIEGGGNKEKKAAKIFGRAYMREFYLSIINGERKDVELVCGPCNKLHFYWLKFGRDNVPFKIIWNVEENTNFAQQASHPV